MRPTIVWFRQDLRLADNPALDAAVHRGGGIVPVFIWSPDEEGDWPPGAASRVWLHHSLRGLSAALHRFGARLILRTGPALDAVRQLAAETAAGAVFWNRRYEPAVLARDAGVKAVLRQQGLEARSFKAALLFEPFEVETRGGGPFKVFAPFWRECLRRPAPAGPLPAPAHLPAPPYSIASQTLASLALLPARAWSDRMMGDWKTGEAAATQRLQCFLDENLENYGARRDFPAEASVSRLSVHLHFGEISPRQVWQAVHRREHEHGRLEIGAGAEAFLRQLGWREFAHHLLYHFPQTPTEPLRAEFKGFPWREDAAALRSWQQGMTGYPIVDAGMRELWHTGWMHNRVRMLAASFLVKGLLVHWRQGARWFWDTLLDADLANNTLGWQWTAGCGADAAPYFRIFNPVLQGRRFDGDGGYVRRWVPELADLPQRYLHAPWTAPGKVLSAAGVKLGRTYPNPCVDLQAARQRALGAWRGLRQARQ